MSPRLADGFRNLVQQTEFPCLGAKSALAKGTLEVLIARDIKSNWDDRRIYDGITRIVQAYEGIEPCFRVLPSFLRVLLTLTKRHLRDSSGHVRKASPIRIRGSVSLTMRVLAAILRTRISR